MLPLVKPSTIKDIRRDIFKTFKDQNKFVIYLMFSLALLFVYSIAIAYKLLYVVLIIGCVNLLLDIYNSDFKLHYDITTLSIGFIIYTLLDSSNN